MRRIMFALLLVALPRLVSAQTHPCEQPPPTQPSIASGAPHRLQFCQRQSDSPQAVIVVIDGTPFDLLPIAAKTPPSATGLVLYETALFLQVSRGTHILTAATYNRNVLTGALQVGPSAPPFTFAAVDDTPLPGAPSIVGVIR